MTQGQTLHENSEHFLSSCLGWNFKQISIPLTKKEFHSLQKKVLFLYFMTLCWEVGRNETDICVTANDCEKLIASKKKN